jgi:hypothetical protein
MIFSIKTYSKSDFETRMIVRHVVYNDGTVCRSIIPFGYDRDRDGPISYVECDLPDDPGIAEFEPSLPSEIAKQWGEIP